jgi:preprotein translocase subunit SecD
MGKKVVYIGLIALCVSGFSLSYAYGEDLPSGVKVAVEFKMVCAGAGQSDCRKAAMLDNHEELYVVNSPFLLTKDIVAAKIKPDSNAIDLQFTTEGTQKFNEVTSKNAGRRMAIFVDGSLLATPKISDPVTSGKITITSSLTNEEAKALVGRINKATTTIKKKPVSSFLK